MKNNKGFSLMELIIVVAIIAVMGSMIGVGSAMLYNNSVGSAYRDLYNTIGSAQMAAMTKEGIYLSIDKEDNGKFRVAVLQSSDGINFTVLDETSLSSNMSLSYRKSGSYTELANSGDGVVVKFKRETGGFDEWFVYNKTSVLGASLGKTVDRLKIAGNRTYEIEMVSATGKFYKVGE